jgi:hypothetical protein
MSPVVAHRDLASRIHVRNALKADKLEPTRMTHSGPSWFASVAPRKPAFTTVIRFTDGRCAVW